MTDPAAVEQALAWVDTEQQCNGPFPDCTDGHALVTLAAAVRELRKELEAAHFVRSKIEHAKCNADRDALRADLAEANELADELRAAGTRMNATCLELRADLALARAVLESAGLEPGSDDPRLRYVTIQVDRAAWQAWREDKHGT